MSTQFFQRQANARTNTSWLVFLFFVAVIGIVSVTSTAGYFVSKSIEQGRTSSGERLPVNPIHVALMCGVVTCGVIVLGSLYQVIALRSGGGSGVAESLGGRPLIASTATTMEEKRLLNVVEEMAIASGTPVPPVYLLEEDGINAFAAGYRPSDAVLGVTRGAVQNLNREQLQGVIAHEFSHILNGDMRINIRMMGILYGILLMALIGRMLLESIRFFGNRSSKDDKGSGGIIAVLIISGVVLLILGWIGHFIGGLIKAAVCRQREYLADASAVQFTRNPNGIGGALKRIGALFQHGRIEHRNAAMASHMFFAQAVSEGISQLLATHPPLVKRILAIDPQWNGSFDAADAVVSAADTEAVGVSPMRARASLDRSSVAAFSGAMPFEEAPHDADDLVSPVVVREAVQHVGAPEKEHRDYSASLLSTMDSDLRQAASDPCVARALVFALLIDRNDTVAAKQWAAIQSLPDKTLFPMTKRLLPNVQCAPEAMRLPLVDMALPSLRQMSRPQYQQFASALQSLIEADHQLSIFEWTLSQVLKRNLRSQFVPAGEMRTRYSNMAKLSVSVSVLLSMLARAGQQDEADVTAAFAVATAMVPAANAKLVAGSACTLSNLESALAILRQASEQIRAKLLEACAACVAADDLVKVRETELLRGIADLLECPMPPIVVSR